MKTSKMSLVMVFAASTHENEALPVHHLYSIDANHIQYSLQTIMLSYGFQQHSHVVILLQTMT
jgi:hypothetical protein